MRVIRTILYRCVADFRSLNFSIYSRWLYYGLFYFLVSFLVTSSLGLFFVLSSYMQITAVRQAAIWSGVLLLFYWVFASMWCLSDKDDYGRAVSASDDFYTTAFTAFWLIEGFLLSLFLSYARLFDFYDPFLENDEIEHFFTNEDCENASFITALTTFSACFFLAGAVDFLLAWESGNSFFLVGFIIMILFLVFYRFFIMSAKFVEDMDIEEDGEDLFDDQDRLFEHEDFPEEGTDGGDYAEGYETLQLFLGYWHYLFIVLHLLYIMYNYFMSSGRQAHLYWAVIAICQNALLAVSLDYLEWGEILSAIELEWVESIYPCFFVGETGTTSISSILSDFIQILTYFYNAILSAFDFNLIVWEEPNDVSWDYFIILILIYLSLIFSVWRF